MKSLDTSIETEPFESPCPEEKEYFVDFATNDLGVLCRVVYNPKTNQYKFKKIDTTPQKILRY